MAKILKMYYYMTSFRGMIGTFVSFFIHPQLQHYRIEVEIGLPLG